MLGKSNTEWVYKEGRKWVANQTTTTTSPQQAVTRVHLTYKIKRWSTSK
jgi:hypothetical protein